MDDYLAYLKSLPRMEKEQLILGVSIYRSGTDSVNSVYLGSYGHSSLQHALGRPADVSYSDWIPQASDEQIDKALAKTWPTIKYMKANPVKRCPCCGQIVRAGSKPGDWLNGQEA